MTDYVALHNHTFFSILDALSSPKELMVRAKELGQSAIAITDHGSLACAWDAFKASKEVGVKYIVGCEFYFINDVANKEDRVRHLVLLAKNAEGYRNILLLNRGGFDHSIYYGKKVYPLIDWKALEAHAEGVICLTSCGSGIVSQLLNTKKFAEAEETAKRLKGIYGDDLAIEIQTNNLKRYSNAYNEAIEQRFTNFHLVNLAEKLNIRVVPTTNSHYLRPEDASTHDVLLAIGSGQSVYSNARLKYDLPQFYVRSADEVKEFFLRTHTEEQIDRWMANTVHFASLCEEPKWIDPKYSNPSGKELPEFPVKDEPDYQEYCDWLTTQPETVQALEPDKSFLRYRCAKNFFRVPAGEEELYQARLDEEFDVIEFHGFSSYMLIVADYIDWARKNGVRVGPGRGSVGGSLIGYLLNIHVGDPIKYKLIFARFHNREKTSFPDIDTDFASSGRDLVKQYVRNKYGEDHVVHVSNINTITPKVYAKDIARACELGGSRESAVKVGTDVADSITADIKSIEKALDDAPLFAAYAKKYPQFEKYAAICGKYRAWATHAGGILISKRPLAGLVPLRKDKDGAIAIEYDKDRAEENGLVKMDMLAVESLDIIDETMRLIKAAGKQLPPDPFPYNEYDKKAYDLLCRGDTFCVFQLGTSGGTIDLCRKVKPQSIEDISHINSLARPAARDIREAFIETKEGKKKFKLLHPSLQRAFGSTYGFGLYEECLMYLAQDVAGWSLHEADRLRKLTKEKGKNPKKAAQWRQDFINDALKNKKISNEIATKIWDDVVDKFQGYGFNLSHSVLYSMTSYQTAYLKAHYPVEFLLANLKSEVKSNAKAASSNIQKIKAEIKKYNVKILPANINDSQLSYSMVDEKTLITGLDALKSVGDDGIREIITKRPFKNFCDFMLRCDSKAVRANTIQALAATGCLDCFGISRRLIFLYVSDYRKKLQTWVKARAKKNVVNDDTFNYPWPKESDWSLPEKYALEKKYLGEAFVCGKRDAYGNFFKDQAIINYKEIKDQLEKKHISSMKVEIKSLFEFKVKKEKSKIFGKDMVKASVEDVNGDQFTLTIFPDAYDSLKDRMKSLAPKQKFEAGISIHFSGFSNVYEDEVGVLMDKFYNFAPPPPLPENLKAQKVSLRVSRKANNETPPENPDKEHICEEVEDELFDEGLIDYNDPEEDDDW